MDPLTPRETVVELDKFIIGQDHIAVGSFKRQILHQLAPEPTDLSRIIRRQIIITAREIDDRTTSGHKQDGEGQKGYFF